MSSVRVAVVGAGPSGLAAARAFCTLGLDVTVYDSAPDVGGVWSSSRRYPGIATQNDKYTYAFTDLAMPPHAADAPDGADVRAYLQDFARVNGLVPRLRLATRVAGAEPSATGWTFETHGPDGAGRESADWLVVANGLSSKPYVPQLAGREAFEAAGGRVLSPSDIGEAEALRDRHVLVIGWGKSAGDIATAAASPARAGRPVHVVARTIGWKLPRDIQGVSFQRVMLSRVGEHLIWGPHRTFPGRVFRRLTQFVRPFVVRRLGRAVSRQLELERRGLVPDVPADQLDHLISDGFLEAVDDARVVVHRGARVAELGASEGADAPRWARLTDGTVVPVDVVVAATGYDQDLELFGPRAKAALVNSQGDLALARYALPERAPNLAFVGWVNSFRNPITAEMQALWVAAVMLGLHTVSSKQWRKAPVFRLGHDVAAARGVPQLPDNGSFLTVDAWLADLDLSVPLWRRRRELFGPMIPGVYADRLALLAQRAGAAGTPPDRPGSAVPASRGLPQPAAGGLGHE